MRTLPALVFLAIGTAALAGGCRRGRSPATEDAGASAAPRCGLTSVIRTTIEGGLVGYGTPRLVVAVDRKHPEGTVVSFPLAASRFAAEYGVSDLCTDDGSTEDRIAVRCLTGHDATITRLVVKRDGGGLLVTRDQKQEIWEPDSFANRCFELHGLETKADLEALRLTWMKNESACPATTPTPKTETITLRLDDPKGLGRGKCGPNGIVTLLGAGGPRALGALDLCDSATIHRLDGVNGIEVVASGGQRFVYQLGDKLYYLGADTRVHAAALPCGARAVFKVVAPQHPDVRETELP